MSQNHTNDPVLLKLHAARVVASEKMPYLSNALFAMVPVKAVGLGTMASDAKWRLYYDPEKIMEWPVEQLAGVVLHEVGHCIRGHAERFTSMGENMRYARTFNIAGDSLINCDLRDERIPLPEGCVYVETLTEAGVEVTREMSAEQIYHLIREKAEEACTCGNQQSPQGQQGQPQQGQNGQQSQQSQQGQSGSQGEQGEQGQGEGEGEGQGEGQGQGQGEGQGQGAGQGQGQGQGSGSQQGQGGGAGGSQVDPNCPVHGGQHGHGDGEPCDGQGCGEGQGSGQGNGIGVEGWDCGSAADNIRRNYEAEGDKVDPGVDEDRGDLIRQQTAVEITNHVKNRGTVPAGLSRWAKEILEPVVDWRKELASLVRRNFAQVAGLRDYTYKRPSRRQAAMKQSGQNIILPAMRQPEPPKVAIVIDTSGSMSDEMLSWALAETQGVLRSLGSSSRAVRVITCDARAEGKRITNISQVELKGGGGTDMRVGIAEAMNGREKPDVCITISDGWTPWPDEPLKGATLIVALTDEGSASSVPSWARTVLVTPETTTDTKKRRH